MTDDNDDSYSDAESTVLGASSSLRLPTEASALCAVSCSSWQEKKNPGVLILQMMRGTADFWCPEAGHTTPDLSEEAASILLMQFLEVFLVLILHLLALTDACYEDKGLISTSYAEFHPILEGRGKLTDRQHLLSHCLTLTRYWLLTNFPKSQEAKRRETINRTITGNDDKADYSLCILSVE